MNKDTYTPMEIDGKIVVVVNAPEKPNENEHWPMLAYIEALSDCTKYPTLEQDAEYWKERIGQRLHRRDLGLYLDDTTYAIPPQQKQEDGDLWESYAEPDTAEKIMDWVNNHVKQYGQLSQSKTMLAIKWIKKLNN